MENKQTAVDLLWNNLYDFLLFSSHKRLLEQFEEDFEKAKEMERKQIIDAHFQGGKKAISIINKYVSIPKTMKEISEIETGTLRYDDGYDYYNETFKSE